MLLALFDRAWTGLVLAVQWMDVVVQLAVVHWMAVVFWVLPLVLFTRGHMVLLQLHWVLPLVLFTRGHMVLVHTLALGWVPLVLFTRGPTWYTLAPLVLQTLVFQLVLGRIPLVLFTRGLTNFHFNLFNVSYLSSASCK